MAGLNLKTINKNNDEIAEVTKFDSEYLRATIKYKNYQDDLNDYYDETVNSPQYPISLPSMQEMISPVSLKGFGLDENTISALVDRALSSVKESNPFSIVKESSAEDEQVKDIEFRNSVRQRQRHIPYKLNLLELVNENT